MTDIERP